jgi:predicted kinase
MKLVIINGPCAVGKSTMATKLHECMPLSFLLDIDAQRRYICKYQKQHKESGALSMEIAFAIVESFLKSGSDVIVDKMICDTNALNEFCRIGKKYEANVHEIILSAPKDVVMKRASDRGYKKDGLFTPEKCLLFWEKIEKVKKVRKGAIVVETSGQREEKVLESLLHEIIV